MFAVLFLLLLGPSGDPPEIVLPPGRPILYRGPPALPPAPIYPVLVVVQDAAGSPIEGAKVTASIPSCVSDVCGFGATGSVLMGGAGSIVVRTDTRVDLEVLSSGFERWNRTVWLPGQTPRIVARLRRGVPLEVRIHGLTLAGDEGASIEVLPADGTPATWRSGCAGSRCPVSVLGRDGIVRFDPQLLAPGRYVLRAEVNRSHSDYREVRYLVLLHDGGPREVSWGPPRLGALRLLNVPRTGCWARVDRDDGRPPSFVPIRDALFVRAGPIIVRGVCPDAGLRTAEQKVQIRAGETSEIELVFQPGPVVRGRILRSDGTPDRSAMVILRPRGLGFGWSTLTNDRGEFTLGPLLDDTDDAELSLAPPPRGSERHPALRVGPDTGFLEMRTQPAIVRGRVEGAIEGTALYANDDALPFENAGAFVVGPPEAAERDLFLLVGKRGRHLHLRPGPAVRDLGTLALAEPWEATGLVLDERTGQPISEAVVDLVRKPLPRALREHGSWEPGSAAPPAVRTDLDGSFRFPSALDGFPVLVSKPGYARELQLLARGVPARIALHRSPEIVVRITGNAPRTCVVARYAGGRTEELRFLVLASGEEGAFPGLDWGTWTLHTGCDPDAPPVARLDVRESRRYPVNLPVSPAAE